MAPFVSGVTCFRLAVLYVAPFDDYDDAGDGEVSLERSLLFRFGWSVRAQKNI